MKKQGLKFLLGIAYIGIVEFFLFAHVQLIEGTKQRMMALVGTLLLAIPAILFLWLYIKIQLSFEREKDRGQCDGFERENEKRGRNIDAMRLRAYVKPYGLSERECEIAWLLYRGYTNRQIAEELFIAESTVKKHGSHIYEKLQIAGKKELKFFVSLCQEREQRD